MRGINSLMASLNHFLNWNNARMECFSLMILGLFSVRTVNLKEIAIGFKSKAQIDSRYRRLQRFFALFEIDYPVIARWIFQLFLKEKDKFYIIIDRTNWYWGKSKINVFMLSIAYEGLAIPLFWTLLDKAGNSNFNEQKTLINQFIKTFGIKHIEGLLADREFANGRFFQWLRKKKIYFYIRIKESSNVFTGKKKLFSAKKIFKYLNPKEKSTFGMSVSIFGQNVFLSGARSERGELMIVASNAQIKNAIAIYLRRWEIENLFKSLKTKGFRFEETHLIDLKRIKKLIAILAIGFVWAHRIGEWLAKKKPIILKNFKHQKRPQHTFFRYGLDFIREILLNSSLKTKQFRACVSLISYASEVFV